MAVTAELYSNFFKNALQGNINNLEGVGALECMLLDVNHTFDEANEFVSDIVINEIADVDYARQTLTGVSVVQGTAAETNLITVDAGDITFGDPVTISANYAVIYQSQTDDTDSPLMFHVDFDGLQESVDGAFVLEVHADGLFDVVT